MAFTRQTGTPRTATRAWQKARAAVLQRDGHQCTILEADGMRCTQPANEVHHLIQPAFGGSDEHGNLIAICHWHHARITARQAAEARRANPANRLNRPAEPHPGIRH